MNNSNRPVFPDQEDHIWDFLEQDQQKRRQKRRATVSSILSIGFIVFAIVGIVLHFTGPFLAAALVSCVIPLYYLFSAMFRLFRPVHLMIFFLYSAICAVLAFLIVQISFLSALWLSFCVVHIVLYLSDLFDRLKNKRHQSSHMPKGESFMEEAPSEAQQNTSDDPDFPESENPIAQLLEYSRQERRRRRINITVGILGVFSLLCSVAGVICHFTGPTLAVILCGCFIPVYYIIAALTGAFRMPIMLFLVQVAVCTVIVLLLGRVLFFPSLCLSLCVVNLIQHAEILYLSTKMKDDQQ